MHTHTHTQNPSELLGCSHIVKKLPPILCWASGFKSYLISIAAPSQNWTLHLTKQNELQITPTAKRLPQTKKKKDSSEIGEFCAAAHPNGENSFTSKLLSSLSAVVCFPSLAEQLLGGRILAKRFEFAFM